MLNESDGLLDFCLVCETPTKSISLGVNACRACSSFFRRSANANAQYKCRRGTKNCSIKAGEKLFCKYCRFEKCKNAGMSLKNIKIMSQEPEKTPTPTLTYNNDNSTINYKSVIKRTIEIKGNKVIYDIHDTITIIKDIFNKPLYGVLQINGIQLSCLQKTVQGLMHLRSSLGISSGDKMTISYALEFRKFLVFWEQLLIHIAELLMYLPDFVKLNSNEKWELFKSFWPLCHVLLHVYFSIEYCQKLTSENVLLSNTESAHFLESMQIVDEEFTPHVKKQVMDLFTPSYKFLDSFVFSPMKELQVDQVEMAYLIMQVLWTKKKAIEIKNGKKENDSILKVISNEIHNHYIYDKKLDNYAWRVAEMAKLLAMIKEFSAREREILLISKFLNIFDCTMFEELTSYCC
uniref:Nuclear receptor domain-containing protein n=1 Tax=Strongyloides stercoralis TaxID=6248 RepID=A0A0K0ER57_STRER